MTARFAAKVIVPDVVGLPFHVGRDVAIEAGVALANPAPDGPPIGALGWPGLFYITAQRPAAGTVVHQWDSVAIELIEYGVDDLDAATKMPTPAPSDNASAVPQSDCYRPW